MYFPSKKDILFILTFWCLIGVLIFLCFLMKNVIPIIIFGTLAGLLVWIWFGTGYRVEKANLKIMVGPFRQTIQIAGIRKIKKVRNPFSAPALSMDRLEISYGKFFSFVWVSPRNESEFIRLLVGKNPHIHLDKTLSVRL